MRQIAFFRICKEDQPRLLLAVVIMIAVAVAVFMIAIMIAISVLAVAIFESFPTFNLQVQLC